MATDKTAETLAEAETAAYELLRVVIAVRTVRDRTSLHDWLCGEPDDRQAWERLRAVAVEFLGAVDAALGVETDKEQTE